MFGLEDIVYVRNSSGRGKVNTLLIPTTLINRTFYSGTCNVPLQYFFSDRLDINVPP